MKYTLTINQKQALELGLNITEAIVLAIIKQNEHIDSYGISKIYILGELKIDTVNRILNSLEKKFIILKHIPTDEDVFNSLNNNHKKGCLFCGVDDIILDKHHYPIRRKDGGCKIIEICPNCHRRFHTITDYRPTYTVLDGIE